MATPGRNVRDSACRRQQQQSRRRGQPDNAEFKRRDAANRSWIERAFHVATEQNATALVLAVHADLFSVRGKDSGFTNTNKTIMSNAIAFRRPVLVIHGDSHKFIIDHAFQLEDGTRLDNVTRLQALGAHSIHASRIIVDPDTSGVFLFQPLYVDKNRARPKVPGK